MTHQQDRREDKFHIDWSLNITSIITILGFLLTIIHYGNAGLEFLHSIDAKTNIMWTHFDKSNLSKDELVKIQNVQNP